jgi:mRNA interferase HicA
VTGSEFLRRLKKLANARGLRVVYDAAHGKGSHGRVYLGSAFTALKHPKQELGSGLLSKICRDLGIKPTDL